MALAGFGLDSLVEIGASLVVLWELSDVSASRREQASHLIGWAFVGLCLYLSVQSVVALAVEHHPSRSVLGICWTALTAVVMFSLARGKSVVGRALGNAVLVAEGRVTLVDGLLAVAVLIGTSLDAALGLWWADPVAGLVLVGYGAREARHLLR